MHKNIRRATQIAGLALVMGVVAFADPIGHTLIPDTQRAGVVMADGCEYFEPGIVRCSDGQAPEFIEPCPAEDAIGCTWDATSQGNGRGISFVVGWDGLPRELAD